MMEVDVKDYEMMGELKDIVEAQKAYELCDLMDVLYSDVCPGDEADTSELINWVIDHAYMVVEYLASVQRRAFGTGGVYI